MFVCLFSVLDALRKNSLGNTVFEMGKFLPSFFSNIGQHMRFWFVLHKQAVKAQMGLSNSTVLSGPTLLERMDVSVGPYLF